MNYRSHYDNLMLKGISRQLSGYKERHHIIPRCMGGDDSTSNIVELTPEEHYVAHQLLVKIYPDHPGLSFAAMTMCQGNSKIKRNNKHYGWLRKLHSKNISNQQTGKIYYNGVKSIRLDATADIPEGFVKGRHYSPTKGTTHSRINDTFKDLSLQHELSKRRWDKDRESVCKQFGVSTLEEVKSKILEFKSRQHPRYWLKPALKEFPFMSAARLRSLIS